MTEENEMIATFFKLPFLAQADFIGDATANTLLMLSLTFIELALSGGVICLFPDAPPANESARRVRCRDSKTLP